MSRYYFLTGLPPILAHEKLLISSQKFLHRARHSLSEKLLADLEKLALLPEINQALKNYYENITKFNFEKYNFFKILNNFHGEKYYKNIHNFCPTYIRRIYWSMLINQTSSIFLHNFAREAVNFYEVLSGLLAKQNKLLKNLYEQELTGSFDSTALVIKQNYGSPDFLLNNRHRFYKKLKTALENPDPMNAEKYMCDHFFGICDELVQNDPFSEDQIYSYFIKLIHIERIQSMSLETGQRIFNRLIKNVHEEIYRD